MTAPATPVDWAADWLRPARWMAWSALGCGLVVLLAASARRFQRDPSVGCVSERWLRDHAYTAGHEGMAP
jgi:hypothetical protein